MMAPIGNNCLTDCLPGRTRGAHKRKHFSPRSALSEVRQDPPPAPRKKRNAGPPPGPAFPRSAGQLRSLRSPWLTVRRSSIWTGRCLRGASGPVIGEALKQAGVTDRSIPGEQLIYRFYDLFGENRPSMEVTRRAVRFASGMGARAGAGGRGGGRRRAGRERSSPSPARSSTSTAKAGRPLVLATTTPYDLVKPLADALGLRRRRGHPLRRAGRRVRRHARRRVRVGPGQAARDRRVGDGERRRPRRELGLLRQLLRHPDAGRGASTRWS